MKLYRHVSILAFFALCSTAFATPSFTPPGLDRDGNQNQNQVQAQSATANSVAGAIAGSAAISGSDSRAASLTNVQTGATTLNAGATTSAASNGNQTINFSTPADVTTRASGTTEVRTVPTVFAPDMVTTANCMIGASGGASGLGWGFAVGTGIEDKNCTRRENARLLKNLGKESAAVKLMCNDPEVAAALGADCAVVTPLPAK
jgi:hypothetical protein